MKHQIRLMLIAPCLMLHGCSWFESSSHCNLPQVKSSVEKLYMTQVNFKATSSLKASKEQNTVAHQSSKNIELEYIQDLDIQHITKSEAKSDADELVNAAIERFQGAELICEGTIHHKINAQKIETLKQTLGEHYADIIDHDQLNIPVIYAIQHQKNTNEYQVQYTAKNPVHIMQAMWILQSSNSNLPDQTHADQE